jgi:hypothetical protein
MSKIFISELFPKDGAASSYSVLCASCSSSGTEDIPGSRAVVLWRRLSLKYLELSACEPTN